MPIYFALHDADFFHGRLAPALADAWRRRSFAPCRALAADLAPAVRAFAERYRTGRDRPLLSQVERGLPFDRASWRLLAGECLLYGAADIPEVQAAPDSLCCLLAPERYREAAFARERLAPIEQAHYGARDLFLGTFYRPEAAGYNGRADVARLADYLAACDPDRWTVDDLRGWREASDDDTRAEELEFARQCLLTLRALYAGAAGEGRVVVCELL